MNTHVFRCVKFRLILIFQDSTSLNIENLQEATSYMVEVEAISSQGSGKMAIRQFSTPALQPQPVGK